MTDDETFFQLFPDRNYHIRKPVKEITIDKQRAAHFGDECEAEFRTLGPHPKNRRLIILYRVPRDNPYYDPQKRPLLKIPFLLFADETVEDTDEVLAPILHGIMEDARARG